jgi:hypothetical protein
MNEERVDKNPTDFIHCLCFRGPIHPTARMLLSGSDRWDRFRQDGFEMLPRARHTARVKHLLAGLHEDDRALPAQALGIERPPPNNVLSSRADPAIEI